MAFSLAGDHVELYSEFDINSYGSAAEIIHHGNGEFDVK